MLYILNHFLWFFLPGLFVLYLLHFNRAIFLCSLAVSYSLMVLVLLPLIHLGADPVWFTHLMYLLLAILLLASAIKFVFLSGFHFFNSTTKHAKHTKKYNFFHSFFRPEAEKTNAPTRQRTYSPLRSLLPLLLLLAAFGIYWLYAGPYLELPTDVFAHLRRVQQMSGVLRAGQFGESAGLIALITEQQTLYWYFIVAWLCALSGTTIEAAMSNVMLANIVTFLAGFFFFAMFLFRKLRYTRSVKAWMAAASVLFCFLHFGVIVFSYVRYYAMGPAMFNHLVFFAALAVWVKFIEGGRGSWAGLFFLPFFTIIMFAVHTQEAVFTAVMIPLVSMASAVSVWCSGRDWRKNIVFWKSAMTFGLSCLGWLVLFVLLRLGKAPSDRYLNYLSVVTDRLPFLRGGMVLNPVFALEVITVWGLFVYLVFVLKIKLFVKSPVLVAGMFAPVVTFFNPLFVDMVLRTASQGGAAVYRFGYLAPLAFVAGWAGVDAVRKLWAACMGFVRRISSMADQQARSACCTCASYSSTSRTAAFNQDSCSACGTLPASLSSVASAGVDATEQASLCSSRCFLQWKPVFTVAWSVLVLAGLIILLFPVHPGMARQSRMLTLRRVPEKNSYRIWADLYEFLQTIPPKHITTDPVTGYVINGLTHHYVSVRRFESVRRELLVESPDTTLRTALRRLQREYDWLLVVNLRDGGMSRVGEVSIHWPPDVLKMAQYYPEVTLEYVANHPEVFVKLWEQDMISVYEIRWPEEGR